MTDPADRQLDTGMRVGEAIARASKWWNETGRGMIPRELNREEQRTVKTGKGVPMIINRTELDTLPSGVLQGKRFEELTHAEQASVVKIWHDNFIRRPFAEAEEATKMTTAQVLTIQCDHPLHDQNEPREAVFKGPTQKNVHRQAIEAGWHVSARLDYCPKCAAFAEQVKDA